MEETGDFCHRLSDSQAFFEGKKRLNTDITKYLQALKEQKDLTELQLHTRIETRAKVLKQIPSWNFYILPNTSPHILQNLNSK